MTNTLLFDINDLSVILCEHASESGNWIFSCPYTIKFWTRQLVGTASGMASDSVRGMASDSVAWPVTLSVAWQVTLWHDQCLCPWLGQRLCPWYGQWLCLCHGQWLCGMASDSVCAMASDSVAWPVTLSVPWPVTLWHGQWLCPWQVNMLVYCQCFISVIWWARTAEWFPRRYRTSWTTSLISGYCSMLKTALRVARTYRTIVWILSLGGTAPQWYQCWVNH